MTNGEAKRLKTDTTFFPTEFKREIVSTEEKEYAAVVENESVKVDLKNRFARLKKSLRKRSVSIL